MYGQKSEDILTLATEMQANSEGVSIQDIMDRFKVSKRTAIRMKDVVLEKFPQAQKLKGQGNTSRWVIPNGSVNNFVTYTTDEVVSLQNAIKLMGNKSAADEANLTSLMNKLKATMDKKVLNRIEPDAEVLLEAEGYAFRPGPKIIINKEFISKLRNAVIACQIVRIKYKGKKRNDWRTVYPYGFLYGNKHYLIGWHTGHQMMTNFDVNKIQELEVTDKYFRRDETFNLQKHSEDCFGIFHEVPFDVEWQFDKEVAEEASKYIFHPKQEMIRNDDGTLTVKFRAGGALEMDWHLYTWGKHVKVIKPENWDTMEKRR